MEHTQHPRCDKLLVFSSKNVEHLISWSLGCKQLLTSTTVFLPLLFNLCSNKKNQTEKKNHADLFFVCFLPP